jgi:hypothetical protein
MGGIDMRKLALFASLVLLVVAVAAPASATKPGTDAELEDGHKIWICHTTRSLSNPYVKILIDIAAWDIAEPDSDDHGPEHHAREKNGIEWADYALLLPTDECAIGPQPLRCPWTGEKADHVIRFLDQTKLWYGALTLATQDAEILGGTYEVILISSDIDRGSIAGGTLPHPQPSERWRLLGTSPSGYSDDLPDGIPDIFDEVTTGLSVTFDGPVTSITAEHWSVVHGGPNPNSVVPQAVCLTLSNGG